MVEIDDVERFLRRFKEKMKFWDIVFLDDRGKNAQTLADLELVWLTRNVGFWKASEG